MNLGTINNYVQAVIWGGSLIVLAIRWGRKMLQNKQVKIPEFPLSSKLIGISIVIGLLVSFASLYFNYRPRIIEKTVTVTEAYKFKWQSLSPNQLTTISHRKFINERVPLDGYRYEDCTFPNVTFVYNGTAAPAFEHNDISGRVMMDTDNNAVFSTGQILKGLGMLKPDVPILTGPQYTEVPIEPPKKAK